MLTRIEKYDAEKTYNAHPVLVDSRVEQKLEVQSKPYMKGTTRGMGEHLAVCPATSPELHQGTKGVGLLLGDMITHSHALHQLPATE